MPEWETPLRLEHKVAWICAQQEWRGFNFDTDLCNQHINQLDSERERLYESISSHLDKEVEVIGAEVKKPFKKDGNYTKMVEDYLPELAGEVGGPFTRIRWNDPDIGSRQKVMKQLARQGWEPTEYTDKGNPKLTEESMEPLGGIGKDIGRWYILSHRRSQLQGWLDNVRKDGRITAGINPNSTNTARGSHILVANIPKPNHGEDGNLLWYPEGKVVFGTEMRSVYIPSEGNVLVGCDVAGLELRVLAHFMNDPEFTNEILSGDIHTMLWEQVNDVVDSRSTNKNVLYAMVFSAGDTKLGATAGYTGKKATEVGKYIRSQWMNRFPALEKLITQVKQASERGYLVGLDGRKIWMRRDPNNNKVLSHKALNTLIQFTGSLLVKTAMCYKEDLLKKRNIESYQVGWFHDEWQQDTNPDHRDKAGETMVEAIKKAGDHFNFRCPLDGEYKIGNSYAETH